MDGFYCDNPDSTQPSVCYSVCGDNIIASDEQCDDENSSDLDGCSSTCTEELGWTSTVSQNDNGTFHTAHSAICGDGRVVETEACDEGPG